MAILSSVPDWAGPVVPAVAAVEDYLLQVYRDTEAPEALGARRALAWASGAPDVPAPLTGRCRRPGRDRAVTEMQVADAVASGQPCPEPAWWEAREVHVSEQLLPDQWELLQSSGHDLHYTSGARCALGWVLGVMHDPAQLAPLRRGDGSPVDEDALARYRTDLCRLGGQEAQPT